MESTLEVERKPIVPDPGAATSRKSGVRTRRVHERFEAQAEATPDACAASQGSNAVTYAELNARANRLARHLRDLGAAPGHPVAVMMERSLSCIAAFLAVLKTGAAYVPIDPDLPRARVDYILEDSGAGCLLLDAAVLSRLGELSSRVATVQVDTIAVDASDATDPGIPVGADEVAYMIYTSGSTGRPKGVMVPHHAFSNYVDWASAHYLTDDIATFAFYSSISFDLTVTSIFATLVAGRQVVVYPERHDDVPLVLRVVEDNASDAIKLTPAHLAILQGCDLTASRLKVLVLGGEDLPAAHAQEISRKLGGRARIYNEYGPTEATVGCMIHRFDPLRDNQGSVPIGEAIDGMRVLLLDDALRPVAPGETGEIHIEGEGVALGYRNQAELTAKVFGPGSTAGSRRYASGDLARVNHDGRLVFLGRKDDQVKIRGYRIELGEIESAVREAAGVAECTVLSTKSGNRDATVGERHCVRCGISSTYPNTTFDDSGECNHCHAFEGYRHIIDGYFDTEERLDAIIEEMRAAKHALYDCIVAFSGGKDSTYALCRIIDKGVRVLAFTLDNGFISDDAKKNIDRVIATLGIDHEYLSTQYMSEIFADSLRRYSNVCNGCFKTIYTLGINLARRVGVDHIVTGLSRGQLLETRLGELLRAPRFDGPAFERNVTEARKIYHRVDDVAGRRLDTTCVRDDAVMEQVRFVDFYRYYEVSREAMYAYIRERVGWARPMDTGRSTNCLINDVGIYVHNAERRFHNYSLPYSWDVRLGHIDRSHALRELDDSTDIDVGRVNEIMADLGYELNDRVVESAEAQLVAYYVADRDLDHEALRERLAERLPDYMLPQAFVRLDQIPLTPNGKVNRQALPKPEARAVHVDADGTPTDALEARLVEIWKEILMVGNVGIHDNFFELGGHSLPALMLLYRIDGEFDMTIGIQQFSLDPTITALARQLRSER